MNLLATNQLNLQFKMEIEQLKAKIKSRRGVPPPGRDTMTFLKGAASESGKDVLDLGTGSGLIAIYFALKGRKVTASDINREALEVAKENALKFNLKVKFIQSDLFNEIDSKFDLILFNPPMGNASGSKLLDYIKSFIPKNKLTLRLASLFFKSERKSLLERFVLSGLSHLTKGGKIVTIIHESERRFIESIIKNKVEVLKHYDYYNDFEIVRISR